MKEHIKIFTSSSILTNRLGFLLEKEGINSIIKDIHESARLAGFGITPETSELYIFKSDVEKAKSIINDFKKEIA